MSVVSFFAERERLQPYRWQTDLWLTSCIKVAKTRREWRPALPALYAELRRRQRIRAVGDGAPVGATTAESEASTNATPQVRGSASGPDVNSSQGDHCGADGGDHDWSVWYWIGGERDECGEHVICRKCREEYVK